MLVKGQVTVRIAPLHPLLAVSSKWSELLLESPVSQPPTVWVSWVAGHILSC